MKVRSQRFGRWVALAALALAVAAIVAPAAGAVPLGNLPCVPHCGTFESEQTAGGPLAGGPTVAQLNERRNAVETVSTPPLSELEKFSFGQPVSGVEPVRPDDQPGLRGPGAADPIVQPLYPVVAPLSGPETVPATPTRVPVTFDDPSGTDWPAVGIAAGLGALLLAGAATMLVASRRRPPLGHA